MIPCICNGCAAGDQPHFYEYSGVKRRMDSDRLQIECSCSDEFVSVPVWLDAVFSHGSIGRDERDRLRMFAASGAAKLVRNKVFVSYSNEDSEALARVRTYLAGLISLGIEVDLWDDTRA